MIRFSSRYLQTYKIYLGVIYNKKNNINALMSDMKNIELPAWLVVHTTTTQAIPKVQPTLLRDK